MNEREVLVKLAFASFESKLESEGIDIGMVKEAIWEGEKFVSGLEDLYNPKGLRDAVSTSLKRMKRSITHGTMATAKTTRKGLLAGTARGFNRLGGILSAADIVDALTHKRKRGSGFFESVGRRTGQIGSSLLMHAPGAVASTVGLADFGAQMVGLPTLSHLTAGAGRMVDKGISRVRGMGRGIRSFFGGGQNFNAKKNLSLSNNFKPKLNQGNKFNLMADYQK